MLRFPEEQLWKLCGQVSHAATFFHIVYLDLWKLCSQITQVILCTFFSRDQCVVASPYRNFFHFLFPECLLCLTFFPFLELPHKKSFLFQWKSYRDRNCYKIQLISNNPFLLAKNTKISDLNFTRLDNKAKNACKPICSQDFLRRTLDNLWGYCCQNYAGYQGLLCQPKTECTK